jgi:hypothetical protein
MKALFITLLMIGSLFASACTDNSTPVCGVDGITYANESNASGVPIISCLTCAQYNAYQASWGSGLWGNTSNTSQYNLTNRSYLERFVSVSVGKVVGDDSLGQPLMAILLMGFFFTFVSFQNIRIEGKAVVVIPASVLAATFVGWLATLIALGVGILIYMALSKIFNK